MTFYAHFASRTALMGALIEQLDELLERTGSPIQRPSSAELIAVVREGARSGIEAWLRERADHWPDIKPYLMSALEAATVDPELRGPVDQWFESAINDIEEGLNQADRFDPADRHMRAFLAFSEFDAVARRWMRRGWEKTDPEVALSLLADSWVHGALVS
ncbi:TetR/AcrR family transcriptional regulator [Streptomyces sp. NPDC002896]|uniref:TetR/AcrR family transcriptional regulator n=1 Tax=Streptomyces sp. NPDC002896 TaxID=3154438 RepID=UPI003330A6C6